MSNKDITEDENFSRRMEENRRLRMEASRSDDLKAFTMAALQGLCANSVCNLTAEGTGKLAVEMAEAALAELEGRG